MRTREANNNSHLFFVPLTYRSRDILNTTVQTSTQKNHPIDASVSCDGFCASQQHHTALCTLACKLFRFEHVSTTAALSRIIISQFVGHGEAAAIAPASSHAVVAAAIPEAGPCGFDWEDIS